MLPLVKVCYPMQSGTLRLQAVGLRTVGRFRLGCCKLYLTRLSQGRQLGYNQAG